MESLNLWLPALLKHCVSVLIFAIVLVPSWIALLGRYFERDVELSWLTVATVVGRAFLLPLVAGMAALALNPPFFERASDVLMKLVGLVLAVTAKLLLIVNWRLLLEIQSPGVLVLICLMLVALAIGHTPGAPGEDDRAALAIARAIP